MTQAILFLMIGLVLILYSADFLVKGAANITILLMSAFRKQKNTA